MIFSLSSMSIADTSAGPRLVQPSTTSTVASSGTPSQTQILAKLDLLISLSLHFWNALNIAIQNSIDLPTAKDKRDWFVGAISELFNSNQLRDTDDLEEVLLQVMDDDFDVLLDDGSEVEIAQKIWREREKVLRGDFAGVDAIYEQWSEKQRRGGEQVQFTKVEEIEDGQDTDWSDQDEDENMEDAPQLVQTQHPPREKLAPEVDEEGFTKVVGRKK